MRHSEDDETTELVDRYITADQAIDLLIAVNALPDETEEEEVEEEEGEEEETSSRSRYVSPPQLITNKVKKPRVCGTCGETGHSKRTCPTLTSVEVESIADEPAKASKRDKSVPYYYNDILDMLRDGLDDTQIYHETYTSITSDQYKAALEWAKGQLAAE